MNKYLLTLLALGLSLIASSQTPTLVKDIMPGEAQSGIRDLTCVGDKVFFFANDGVHGIELWVSDGTTDGTHIVKDINPDSSNAVNVNFRKSLTDFHGTALFFALDEEHGYELWKSDGTEEGTEIVADIRAGDESSMFNPGPGPYIRVMGDYAYFNAYTDGAGWEVWRTDGITTTMLPEMIAGENFNDYPSMLTVIGDRLYYAQTAFSSEGGIYVTDGVTVTTLTDAILTANNNPKFANFFIEYDGFVYFTAGWTETTMELWRTDGTAEGTAQFADLDGAQEGDPRMTQALSNGFLFVSDNSEGDNTLYICDGTVEGITPLTYSNGNQLIVANYSAWEQRFLLAGDYVYFPSEDGTCITDGTSAGTHLLSPFELIEFSSEPYDYHAVVVGNNIIWEEDGLIISSNGTAAGTNVIMDEWDDPQTLVLVNDLIFMVNELEDDDPYGDELYVFTPEFTVSVSEIEKKSQWLVYPNPSHGEIRISGLNGKANVCIYNNIGSAVMQQTVNGNESIVLPKSISTGVYCVKLESDDIVETYQLVITN